MIVDDDLKRRPASPVASRPTTNIANAPCRRLVRPTGCANNVKSVRNHDVGQQALNGSIDDCRGHRSGVDEASVIDSNPQINDSR